MSDYFKIQGLTDETETAFWSNEDGWVDWDSATIFQEEDRHTINLPIYTMGIVWFTQYRYMEQVSITRIERIENPEKPKNPA